VNISDRLVKAADAATARLMTEVTGSLAVIVSSIDGFEVSARAIDPEQISRMAAIASSMSALGSVVGRETLLGNHRGISIEIDHGFVVMVEVMHPETPLILTIVASRKGLLGQLLYCANQSASSLAKV
jgi:uncharacterized protein